MRRFPVSFPLALGLFAAAHPHRAIRAVFRSVGLRRKRSPAFTAAFHFVPVFRDLGVQDRVQREDSGLKPPAQQRIGNALYANTFFAIVQQQTVPVTVIAALMPATPRPRR